MLSRLSVRTKLFLMLLVPLLLFAITAVFLLQTNSSNINRLSSLLYDTTYQSSTLVLNADRDMYQALSAYQALQNNGNAGNRDANVKDFNDNVAQVNDRIKQTVALIQQYGLEDTLKSNDGRPFKETLTQVVLNFNQWAFGAKENIEKNQFAADKEAELTKKFKTARAGIDLFSDVISTYSQNEIDTVKRDRDTTNASTYTALVIAWVVLLLLGYLIIRRISQTVQAVLLRTRRVSDGDLRTAAAVKYTGDELGEILKSVDVMTANMKNLIGQITSHTRSVSAASQMLSTGARESAAASDNVAQNIQEVTSLVDTQSQIAEESSRAIAEMAAGVNRIAQSAGAIANHSQDTNEQAELGNSQLKKLEAQLGQISASIENLGRSIAVLTEKSEKIGSITENITSFANQTNILSLNAGIEAARAGEHGKGFAVVASEIRKLAAGSLESASSIAELIGDTRGEIENTSGQMEQTIEQARQGSVIMQEVSQGFEAILASIRQVAAQIEESSAVTQQMSASSEEVLASMEHSSASAREIAGKAQNVSAATEEQLALVENIAKASDSLEEVVSELNRSVETFKI